MLAQEVAAKYQGKVEFRNENFGASKLADHFGVKGYPAVFIDDILVAVPRDFGYFGGEDGKGRYAPWRNAENQNKYKADLTRMIDLILAGKEEEVRKERGGPADSGEGNAIASLPKFSITDVAGHPLTSEELSGRPVIVEFWATWCPPCRSTLEWLGELKQKYGNNLVVVALAIESPDDEVGATLKSLSPDVRWAVGDANTGRAFGDIVSVPTMFLFDRGGKTAHVFYGAPPDLHQEAEKRLEAVMR